MKKFLSLVLALVMTMSLVTISAGAAEYKDLTDKDEIQYEEAVAVLNRIGIITGYSDGSFQPKTELTRGAAAKIIVSLMIGSEAANNLVAQSAPYSDVPVDHTFAGVISYCKTAGYINGYSDGTFRPAGTLSGYAFAKMLLGALGYVGANEGGFTGAGWTMNVARLGNAAGLFDRLTFKGNEAVNREQACQLALNTLKATLVEYSGGMTITSGDATITGGAVRSYKTSNQEFATHISRRAGDNVEDGWYTVEFGEEHFVDLRRVTERGARDDFGRPSNEWSYKKVTIGTYPVEADFTYTAQVAHNVSTVTDATKVRDLGLNGYQVNEKSITTQLHMNGVNTSYSGSVADIADYTDNGTLVEVYVSDTTADVITDIVVVQSQLMEVKRIGSDDVTLDKVKPDTEDISSNAKYQGFNQDALHVDVLKVEVDNDNFEFLKGLKAGDEVVVIPVQDGSDFVVSKAYTPEKVEGKLTRANSYGNASGRGTIGLTVGGTEYKSSLWNKKIIDIDADSVKYTKGDVTLQLDEYGYALKAKGVGETEDFFVIKDSYQSLENGKLVTYVEGWDVKGNELSLNVGTSFDSAKYAPGDLVEYTNVQAKDPADWRLMNHADGGEVFSVGELGNAEYEIKASNVRVSITNARANDDHGADPKPYITNDVKFIFVTFDNGDVDSIEVKNGVQNVSTADIAQTGTSNYGAQLCLNDDGEVTAVVIKKEANDATSTSLLYIRDWDGAYSVDATGKRVYQYTVAMMGKDGFEPNMKIWADKDLEVGTFASYNLSTNEGFEPYYKLRQQTEARKTTSVNSATVRTVLNEDKGIVELAAYGNGNTNLKYDLSASLGVGDETNAVSMIRSEWLDLTGNSINSVGDLNDFIDDDSADAQYAQIKIIYNDNPDNDGFRTVSLVVIEGFTAAKPDAVAPVAPAPVAVEKPAAGVDTALDGQGVTFDPDDMTTPASQFPEDPAVKLPMKEKAEGTVDVNKLELEVTLTPNVRAGEAVKVLCTVANGRIKEVTPYQPAQAEVPPTYSETGTKYATIDDAKDAIGTIYTRSGAEGSYTYTKVTKFNEPAVWDDGTLGSALTEGWADGVTYYTTKGDTSSVVDTSAVTTPDADTTYYTITTPAVDDGNASWTADTEFYTQTSAGSDAVAAVPASWTVVLKRGDIPAGGATITAITVKNAEEAITPVA